MKKTLSIIFSGILGAITLVLLSLLQKLILNIPFTPVGFIVPILFGCVSGAVIKILYDQVTCYLASHREAKNELEKKVNDRTNELNIQKKRLLDAQKIAHLGHWEWNLIKDEHLWSDELYQILGYAPQACKANYETFINLLHPADYSLVTKNIEKALNNEKTYDMEHRLILADSSEKIIHGQAEVLFNEQGKPVKILGTIQDITKQHNNLEQLIESQKQFKRLFDSAQVGMMYITSQRILIKANKRLAEILGYPSPQAMEGLSMLDIHLSKENFESFGKLNFESLRMGANRYIEYQLKKKDGHPIWIELSGKVLDDNIPADMEKGILWILNDISLRKKYQQELLDAKHLAETLSKEQESLLSLFEKGDAVLFKWENTKNWPVKYVSKSVHQLFGYSGKKFIEGKISYTSFIYKDDAKRVGLEVQQAIDSGCDFFKHEPYRIITYNNQIKWVLDYSSTLKNKDGNITHFIGYIFDITKRKNRELLREFKHNLVDLSHKYNKEKLLQRALDSIEKLTQSKISFFYFVEKGKQPICSKNTLKNTHSSKEPLHCHINLTEVLSECREQQQSIINNKPISLTLPTGPLKLTGLVTIPIFRKNKIVAIICLANKTSDYTQSDIKIFEQLSDITYDIYEQQYAEERIKHMAYYDILTGLPNRQLLSDRIDQAMAMTKRSKKLFAFCYLDLDAFKPVNDQYGHHIGDKLLAAFAKRLSTELRSGDTMARLGGDEFALILNNLSSSYEGVEIIERLLESAKSPFEIDQHRIHISSSIGVTFYPMDKVDTDTLMLHADQAMYQAKTSGRSIFKAYDPIENENLHKNKTLHEAFTKALQDNQLVLYYQPKIDLRDGTIMGFEALIRWHHPDKGLLYPGDFLPLIENSPQELALGEWVIINALKQLKQWLNDGHNFVLSVNISPRQIQLQGFVDFLSKALKKYPTTIAKHFELEILEIADIADIQKVSQVMDGCKKLNVQFALDDFGTGYSSLTYFHQLPIDILKIDQNFVKNILDNAEELNIVEGVLYLAKSLNRPVIAEGVESIEIALMLLYIGCQYAQGYGIARPMPVEAVQHWIDSWNKENLWGSLKTETTGDAAYYDINVAIYSHRQWLKKMNSYTLDPINNPPPKLEESQCQFGRWYHGAGKTRYGTHKGYLKIQDKHHKVHHAAIQINNLITTQEQDKAIKILDALNEYGQQLITLLSKLIK